MDAIQQSGTSSAVHARNLCIEAKCGPAEQIQKQNEEAEQHALQESKPKIRKYFLFLSADYVMMLSKLLSQINSIILIWCLPLPLQVW